MRKATKIKSLLMLFIFLFNLCFFSVKSHSESLYCETGQEYVASFNNMSVVVNSINKVDKGGYFTYVIDYTQTNRTTARIDEGNFHMYFSNRTQMDQYGFFNTLMPGDSIRRTYSFDVLKDEIPSILAYTEGGLYTSPYNGLIWDVTPPEQVGKSSNANLGNITVDSGSLSPYFNPAITNYSVSVKYETTNITIDSYEQAYTKAVVTGNGTFDLNVGLNTFKLTVTAENGQQKEYSINVFRQDKPSSNANLKSITADIGQLSPLIVPVSPAFDPNITNYDIYLKSNEHFIKFFAYTEDGKASVNYNSGINYLTSDKAFTFTCTAEDGTKKDYVVNVKFLSGDSYLSGITLNDTPIVSKNGLSFSPYNKSYEVNVPNNVDTIKVGATGINANAKIISGIGQRNLAEGYNNFHIEVCSEDGLNYTSYEITIYRMSNNANLSSIRFGVYSLNPISGFDPSITEYTFEVLAWPNYNDYSLAAYVENGKAGISEISKDGGYRNLNLALGANVFKFLVTAEDGTQKTYTVTINYRVPSSNTNLSKLVTDVGQLSPSFSPDITEYTLKVSNFTTRIKLDAEAEDSKAFFYQNGYGGFTYGNNTVTTTVIAEDQTQKTYTIIVNRSLVMWDLNIDDKVDVKDLAGVASKYGRQSNASDDTYAYDLNYDGVVDIYDLVLISRQMR